MDSHFDTEKFIIEIENRPAIWNSACSEYSIRDVKRKCWEELTDIFSNEDNTVQEKKEIGELKKIIVKVIKINNNKRINLQRKWKSLRDCFSRELARVKKLKSGSETSRKNPYVYYNQLLFLLPIIQNKPTETNITADGDESGDDLGGSFNRNVLNNEPSSKKKKANPRTSVENEIISALHKSVELREEQAKHSEEDADRLFLLSLLKDLKQIPEPLRFSVKMDLMKVINNAQMNTYPASLNLSHPQRPQQYNLSGQNVMSHPQQYNFSGQNVISSPQQFNLSGQNVISSPQQYNLSSQNIMSHINQDPCTSRSIHQTNQLFSDPNYQRVLQNQFNSQIRPSSATQHNSSTSTPLASPNYNSTENSTDSYIETDLFNPNLTK